MTISLSNLIKAYSIKYDDKDKRVIDMNAAAEEKIRHYVELLKLKQPSLLPEEGKKDSEEGFVPGLFAAAVEELSADAAADLKQRQLFMQEQILRNQQATEDVTEKAKNIIEEAKEEVKRILENAKAEASVCAELIKEEAYQKGYQEGHQKSMKELEALKKSLEDDKLHYATEYEKKVKDLEPSFVNLLISFMKRFTGVVLDDKREIIFYLLEQELLSIEGSNRYLIHVSRDDYELVSSKKEEITWKVNDNATIEIIEDRTLSRAQCFIETDSRIIDCSLDIQLRNLVNDLKLLAGPKVEEI